jgi:hypothetical protein
MSLKSTYSEFIATTSAFCGGGLDENIDFV